MKPISTKLLPKCGEERERKFIKSAIKMISTSLFHPLIFFASSHPLLRFRKNALNTQFFSLLFSVIILFRHHESLTFSLDSQHKKNLTHRNSFCFSVGGSKKFPFEKTFYFFFHHAKLCALLFQRGFNSSIYQLFM